MQQKTNNLFDSRYSNFIAFVISSVPLRAALRLFVSFLSSPWLYWFRHNIGCRCHDALLYSSTLLTSFAARAGVMFWSTLCWSVVFIVIWFEVVYFVFSCWWQWLCHLTLSVSRSVVQLNSRSKRFFPSRFNFNNGVGRVNER